MKNILPFPTTILVLLFLLSACGPSAKEYEGKRISDSVRVADSLAMNQSEQQKLTDAAAGKPDLSNDLKLSTKTPAGKQFLKTAETKFRVGNVRKASDQIEDMAVKYSGYLTYSHLQNIETEESAIRLSRDSLLISRKIVVEDQIVLRIPNENLDSLVRALNKLILFLDYRIVKLDEITFNLLANRKAIDRLKEYEARQKKHIDTKTSKLKETTNAEENVLNRQNQADNLDVESMALADQVKYCNLTLYIYQKPIWYKEVQVLPDTDSSRPNLFARIGDSLVEGWIIFEYILVFLFRIWWLIAIFGTIAVTILVLLRRKKK